MYDTESTLEKLRVPKRQRSDMRARELRHRNILAENGRALTNGTFDVMKLNSLI